MALTFGFSSKHRPTAIYKNYIYNKYKVNKSGYVTWRCPQYQRHKCHAQLVTKEDQLVSNQAPVHTHGITNSTKNAGALENALGEEVVAHISQHPRSEEHT